MNIPSCVRVEGIGPSTSVLSGQRSTTELHTHARNYLFHWFLQSEPSICLRHIRTAFYHWTTHATSAFIPKNQGFSKNLWSSIIYAIKKEWPMWPLLHALFKREGKKLWIYFIGICIYSSLQYYHRTLFCQTKIPIGRLGFLSSVSLGFEMSHRRNILGTDRKRKPKNRTRLVYQYSFFYATLFSQICLWITI